MKRLYNFDNVLNKLTNQRQVFVVDIGAFDGRYANVFYNHVQRWKWSGLFVEPVKRSYDRMVVEIMSLDIMPYRCAVWTEEGEIEIQVAPDNAEMWQKGSSTVKSRNRGICNSWSTELVPCKTLQQILVDNDVTQIDALNIDTEGCDYLVLQQVDFTKYRPKGIKIETGNLTNDERDGVFTILHSNGYVYEEINNGWDVISAYKEWWND